MVGDVKIVVFAIGDARYGVEITSVREIVSPEKVTMVPGAPAQVIGITSLRGRLMPVVCLASCLGIHEPPAKRGGRIIVVERDKEIVGLKVSSVTDVVSVSREDIMPMPDGLEDQHQKAKGLARIDAGLVTLIDICRVIDLIEA